MTTSVFESLTRLFQSQELSLRAANHMNRAYYIGIGKPDEYKAYGLDQPQQVAMDLAGIYAADTAANNVGHKFRDDGIETGYMRALELLAADEWSVLGSMDATYMVMNVANTTWRAGQPFRDMATNPLNRIGRTVNMQFNLLSAKEQYKDIVQIRAAARFLLDHIREQDAG